MKVLNLHFLFYAKVVGALLVVFLVYKNVRAVIRIVTNRRLARELNCQDAQKLKTRDPVLGLDLFYTILQDVKTKNTLEAGRDRYKQVNANTFSFPLLGGKVFTTCEPDNIKAILSTNFEDWCIEPLRKQAVPFVGRGIFTTDGPAWQHSRNLLKPMFTRSMLADVSVFEMHVDRLISHIPHDGSTIDLQPLFFQLTLDITSHVMLGESTDLQVAPTGTRSAEFAARFQRCLNYFGSDPGIEIFGYPIPTAKYRQFRRDCRAINAYVDKYIKKAYEETADPLFSPKSPGADPNRNILLYDLVSQEVPRDHVRSEILNTILAGRDTTASLLSDVWFELSKHPKIFRKLHDEVHSLCPPGSEITFDLLKSMPYLRAVLNESLRFHPVVPENGRLSTRNTTLPLGGGPDGSSPIFIPKRTLFIYSVYSMHRRADLWENPDSFVPERWLDTEEQKGVRPGWSFLPFNGGPRVCVGQQFALLLVSYVTVRMVQGIKIGDDGVEEGKMLGLESRDPEDWKENVTVTCTGLGGCKVGVWGPEKEGT